MQSMSFKMTDEADSRKTPCGALVLDATLWDRACHFVLRCCQYCQQQRLRVLMTDDFSLTVHCEFPREEDDSLLANFF
jgi:hypothetical protein